MSKPRSRGKAKKQTESPVIQEEVIQDTGRAVNKFKSAIIRIRNLLRGDNNGIANMDGFHHIIIYLLARYITKEKADLLQIPHKLCWETLMDKIQNKNGGLQESLDAFSHHEEDCLIRHFDRLFGTQRFTFTLRNLDTHKEILQTLNIVDMKTVDCEIDLLGWIFEHHIDTGSITGRDRGQYFTNRAVCKYMTDLCQPQLKSNGTPETVCDPTMGSGGFLSTYVKYCNQHYGDKIDWKVHQKVIYGYDNDPVVAGTARINLFMETGGLCLTNLETRDSLYEGPTVPGFDIILANMPFGIDKINRTKCCARVKALKIKGGAASEPLFLQMMMASLNKNGRCAVVVPDGVLFNKQALHTGTRKYLLDHFELKRVIKMKGKFFMNTGIQPSILFFVNTGKQTEKVEFWQVEQGQKDEVVEKMIATVPREKIGTDYSLDIRRYLEGEKDEKTETVNFGGYTIAELQDIVDYENGKTLAKEQKIENGEYDVMGGGMTYVGKTDRYNRDGETVSISKSGASAGFVAYHNKKYWAGDCLTVVPKDETKIRPKFLYYYLRLNPLLTMSNRTGTTIPHCKWDDIKKTQIIIPPLSIQQEIVTTLDLLYGYDTTMITETIKLTSNAMNLLLSHPNGKTLEPIIEAHKLSKNSGRMIADLKAQMIAIIKAVERRSDSTVPLSQIATIESGDYITKADGVKKGFPIYGGGDACSYYSATNNRSNRLVVAKDGVSLKCVRWITGPFHLNHHGWTFGCNDTILEKYLYYYLMSQQEKLFEMATGSAQKGINQKTMHNYPIVLPALAIQQNVIARLDALQSQIDALETLQKNTEENARFILESYLGATTFANNTDPTEQPAESPVDEPTEEDSAEIPTNDETDD